MFGRIFCRHQANYRAYALPPFCHYSQTVMVMENQEIYGAKSFSAPMIFANLAGISVLKAATFEPDGDLLQRGLAWNLAPVMKYARSYEYERDPAGQKVWYIGLVLDIFGYGRTGQGWFAKVGLPFGPAANDDKAMGLMMFFY
ncbi:MAG: hypothetical protein HY979_00515 [Candidatus Magasanikbacteria bacterium]|nr:hypothetical protein [Candidatus Magasanikbacteria bacterium]